MCTCNGKYKKPVDKQCKKKVHRAYERGIKQINVIDMASIARKQVYKLKDTQARKRTKCGVCRRTNVGLDRMSITSLC